MFCFIVSFINKACIVPWLPYPPSCYLVYAVSSISPGHTWNDSRSICQGHGGNLVKLETENETALISSFFKDQIVEANSYWIGKGSFSIKISEHSITTLNNLKALSEEQNHSDYCKNSSSPQLCSVFHSVSTTVSNVWHQILAQLCQY